MRCRRGGTADVQPLPVLGSEPLKLIFSELQKARRGVQAQFLTVIQPRTAFFLKMIKSRDCRCDNGDDLAVESLKLDRAGGKPPITPSGTISRNSELCNSSKLNFHYFTSGAFLSGSAFLFQCSIAHTNRTELITEEHPQRSQEAPSLQTFKVQSSNGIKA